MTLRLDKILPFTTGRPFSSKTPRGINNITQSSILNGLPRFLHRQRPAVIKVQRKEQILFLGLRDKHVRLIHIEYDRLLDKKRDACLDDLQGRAVMLLIPQADTDEVRPFHLDHLLYI